MVFLGSINADPEKSASDLLRSLAVEQTVGIGDVAEGTKEEAASIPAFETLTRAASQKKKSIKRERESVFPITSDVSGCTVSKEATETELWMNFMEAFPETDSISLRTSISPRALPLFSSPVKPRGVEEKEVMEEPKRNKRTQRRASNGVARSGSRPLNECSTIDSETACMGTDSHEENASVHTISSTMMLPRTFNAPSLMSASFLIENASEASDREQKDSTRISSSTFAPGTSPLEGTSINFPIYDAEEGIKGGSDGGDTTLEWETGGGLTSVEEMQRKKENHKDEEGDLFPSVSLPPISVLQASCSDSLLHLENTLDTYEHLRAVEIHSARLQLRRLHETVERVSSIFSSSLSSTSCVEHSPPSYPFSSQSHHLDPSWKTIPFSSPRKEEDTEKLRGGAEGQVTMVPADSDKNISSFFFFPSYCLSSWKWDFVKQEKEWITKVVVRWAKQQFLQQWKVHILPWWEEEVVKGFYRPVMQQLSTLAIRLQRCNEHLLGGNVGPSSRVSFQEGIEEKEHAEKCCRDGGFAKDMLKRCTRAKRKRERQSRSEDAPLSHRKFLKKWKWDEKSEDHDPNLESTWNDCKVGSSEDENTVVKEKNEEEGMTEEVLQRIPTGAHSFHRPSHSLLPQAPLKLYSECGSSCVHSQYRHGYRLEGRSRRNTLDAVLQRLWYGPSYRFRDLSSTRIPSSLFLPLSSSSFSFMKTMQTTTPSTKEGTIAITNDGGTSGASPSSAVLPKTTRRRMFSVVHKDVKNSAFHSPLSCGTTKVESSLVQQSFLPDGEEKEPHDFLHCREQLQNGTPEEVKPQEKKEEDERISSGVWESSLSCMCFTEPDNGEDARTTRSPSCPSPPLCRVADALCWWFTVVREDMIAALLQRFQKAFVCFTVVKTHFSTILPLLRLPADPSSMEQQSTTPEHSSSCGCCPCAVAKTVERGSPVCTTCTLADFSFLQKQLQRLRRPLQGKYEWEWVQFCHLFHLPSLMRWGKERITEGFLLPVSSPSFSGDSVSPLEVLPDHKDEPRSFVMTECVSSSTENSSLPINDVQSVCMPSVGFSSCISTHTLSEIQAAYASLLCLFFTRQAFLLSSSSMFLSLGSLSVGQRHETEAMPPCKGGEEKGEAARPCSTEGQCCGWRLASTVWKSLQYLLFLRDFVHRFSSRSSIPLKRRNEGVKYVKDGVGTTFLPDPMMPLVSISPFIEKRSFGHLVQERNRPSFITRPYFLPSVAPSSSSISLRILPIRTCATTTIRNTLPPHTRTATIPSGNLLLPEDAMELDDDAHQAFLRSGREECHVEGEDDSWRDSNAVAFDMKKALPMSAVGEALRQEERVETLKEAQEARQDQWEEEVTAFARNWGCQRRRSPLPPLSPWLLECCRMAKQDRPAGCSSLLTTGKRAPMETGSTARGERRPTDARDTEEEKMAFTMDSEGIQKSPLRRCSMHPNHTVDEDSTKEVTRESGAAVEHPIPSSAPLSSVVEGKGTTCTSSLVERTLLCVDSCLVERLPSPVFPFNDERSQSTRGEVPRIVEGRAEKKVDASPERFWQAPPPLHNAAVEVADVKEDNAVSSSPSLVGSFHPSYRTPSYFSSSIKIPNWFSAILLGLVDAMRHGKARNSIPRPPPPHSTKEDAKHLDTYVGLWSPKRRSGMSLPIDAEEDTLSSEQRSPAGSEVEKIKMILFWLCKLFDFVDGVENRGCNEHNGSGMERGTPLWFTSSRRRPCASFLPPAFIPASISGSSEDTFVCSLPHASSVLVGGVETHSRANSTNFSAMQCSTFFTGRIFAHAPLVFILRHSYYYKDQE